MDNTTNYVESMWNMLKYRVLKRRYNHSTYEMLVALVGGPEPDKGGCLVSYIQCREVARTYRTGGRSFVQRMARESKKKGLEMFLRWKKEGVLEERINLQDCKTLTFEIHSESQTNNIYLVSLANPRTCGPICDCSAHGSTASCKHGWAARHYAQEILRCDVAGKISETFGGKELSVTETDSNPVDGSQMSPGCAQNPEGAASPVTESPSTTEGAREASAPEAKAIAKELAALALKMERLGSAIPSSAVRLAKRAATECDPEICWTPVLDAAAKGARSREKYVANSGNFSGHVARKLRRKKSLRTSPGKGSQVDPAHARRLKPSDTSSAQPAL
ncbi:MAG: hypothetical protein VX683_02720, partial [Cyanobacteriota bacterium]|nr:hypothetical protein [Cyanobacteriota bacterium]